MKRLILRTSFFLLVSLSLIAVASEIWPKRTTEALMNGTLFLYGLEEKTVETSVGSIHYLEGGRGEAVVFLHGIFALKEHWLDLSHAMSEKYHVILLDLPGFGENMPLAAEAYDYNTQTKNIIETLDLIGLQKFHLVANSMGGQIAGMIAKTIPHQVQTIAFIGGAAGIKSPIASDMEKSIRSGHNPMLVKNIEQYRARMGWLFPNQPFIPRPIVRSWAKREINKAEHNAEIWHSVWSSLAPSLEKIAPDIKQRSLIIWCEADRIFHVRGAEKLDSLLSDSQLIRPLGCGHLPLLDRPVKTGQEIMRFLESGS